MDIKVLADSDSGQSTGLESQPESEHRQPEDRMVDEDVKTPSETLFAIFFLDGQEFGLEVENVREAVRYQDEIIKLPTSVDIVEGVINLRGAIIPVINLRTRLALPPSSPKGDSHFAIIKYQGYYYGMLFDNISEVIRVSTSDINRIDENGEDQTLCEIGILLLEEGRRLIQLLEPNLLFDRYQLPRIENDQDEQAGRKIDIRQNITFVLAGQEYALDASDIQEIIRIPEIQRRVEVEDYIRGAANLRGELVTIVDLRRYMGLPRKEPDSDARVIILRGDLPCGILVDGVREVIHFAADQLLPIPDFDRGRFHEVFSGVISLSDQRHVIQINPQNLFDEAAAEQIRGNINVHLDAREHTGADARARQETFDDRVFITFNLGQLFAVDIHCLREIINHPEHLLTLPGGRTFSAGVLNLRGEAIPIIDLRAFYALGPYPSIHDAKVMILKLEDCVFGIMVDDIREIIKAEQLTLVPMTSMVASSTEDRLKQHVREVFERKDGDSQMIMVLDTSKLMHAIRLATGDAQTAGKTNGYRHGHRDDHRYSQINGQINGHMNGQATEQATKQSALDQNNSTDSQPEPELSWDEF